MQFTYSSYHGLPSPIIPIELQARDGELKELWAYVDSGAAYSIFSAEVAPLLGLDLQNGTLLTAMVGNGEQIPVHLFRLRVKIGDEELENVTIGFSEGLGIGFHILGRKDIFDRFRVCFNDRDRILTVDRL